MRRRRPQAGFTLVEVLVAMVLFAISVVGLVAMEARSVEAQRASSYIREAERVAQDEMAELQSRGFVQLLTNDFTQSALTAIPYNDDDVDPSARMRDYRRSPADQPASTLPLGTVRNSFLLYRQVDWFVDPVDPPSNPPDLTVDLPRINALVLQVTVMWVDDSNPVAPPPADFVLADVTPNMADPTDADFRPYVGSVQLRTVRANDTTNPVPP